MTAPTGFAGIAAIAVLGYSSWLCAVIAHNTVHTPRLLPAVDELRVPGLGQPLVRISDQRLHPGPQPLAPPVPAGARGRDAHHQGALPLESAERRWRSPSPSRPPSSAATRATPSSRAARPGGASCRLEVVIVWGVKLVLLAIDWRKTLAFVLLPQLVRQPGHRRHQLPLARRLRRGAPVQPLPELHRVAAELPGPEQRLPRDAPRGAARCTGACCPRRMPAASPPGAASGARAALAARLRLADVRLSGRREMYDGRPMVFPEVDTDLDWVEPERSSAVAPDSALPA